MSVEEESKINDDGGAVTSSAPVEVEPDSDDEEVEAGQGGGAEPDLVDDREAIGNGEGSDGSDGAEPGPPKPPPAEPQDRQRFVDRHASALRTAVDVTVVTVCTLFVLLQLGPRNLISDTTPSGGDMGAHVWGPAYLRDYLLPNLQLTGWSPDWYAGFATYQFYMVVPSLLIVLLDFGLELGTVPGGMMLGLAVGAAGMAIGLWEDRRRRYVALAVAGIALLLVGLPYGVAFKLVSVSGALTLPVAAYTFGRLAGMRFPGPNLLAVATLPYLFYRGYSIYGGNIASTLAGEFAFSMSLSLGLVYLGVVFRGLETGRHRALAAVLLALTGLCHIIPAFWVLGGSVVIVLLRHRRSTAPVLPCAGLGAVGLLVLVLGLLLSGLTGLSLVAYPLLGVGALLALAGAWLYSQSVRWLTPVLAVGGMLSAFWVVPFALRSAFVNDMGWEKLPYVETGSWWDRYAPYLWPHEAPPHIERTASEYSLRWAIALAAVGAIVSIAVRVLALVKARWVSTGTARMAHAGTFLAGTTFLVGVAFVLLPEDRLWNGRLLPFYYLTCMLLAMVVIALAMRGLARLTRQRNAVLGSLGSLGALVAVLIVVGLPLGALWFSEQVQKVDSEGVSHAGYSWPQGSPWQIEAAPESFLPHWANWNYQGYEGKPNYPEYYNVVTTMERVGDELGCGRALWEYEPGLDRYGTPMALMLLPYWTDGCIGSMEGLFFESSMTTPYHFVMQTELSESPSSAQRDMPYNGFNMNLGVQHLQLMGVRYYMATSQQAIQAAREHPDLTETATSGPWEIFEVADSEVITPLSYEPAVLSGVGHGAGEWLEEPRDQQGRFYGPSVEWFLNPAAWDVPLSLGGPDEWQRIEPDQVPDSRRVTPTQVSDVDVGRDTISFGVDRVGSPVLVKASYFPNWQVSGAEGPWRVTPNLMVVVPTENQVELSYGRTSVEWLAYALTTLGVVGLVLLSRRGVYRFTDPPEKPSRRSEAGLPDPEKDLFRQAAQPVPEVERDGSDEAHSEADGVDDESARSRAYGSDEAPSESGAPPESGGVQGNESDGGPSDSAGIPTESP